MYRLFAKQLQRLIRESVSTIAMINIASKVAVCSHRERVRFFLGMETAFCRYSSHTSQVTPTIHLKAFPH